MTGCAISSEGETGHLADTFAALAHQTDVLGLLLASSRDCIKLINLDGRLEDMNCGGLDIMQIDDFCMVKGQAWASLWPQASQSQVLEALARARCGEQSTFRAFCPTAKGTPRWWDVTVTPVKSSGQDVVKIISVSRDVTEHHELLQASMTNVEERDSQLAEIARELNEETVRLSELRRQLSHSEKVRLLGDLVGHIVHDMNNVLAVLSSSFRMVRRKAKDVVPQELFDHGEEAIDRGSTMVRQLLDFARGGEDVPELLRVDQTLEGWLGMLRHLAGRAIKVDITCASDLPDITVRASALQSVIFNLAANARDAMPEGGTISVGAARAPGTNGGERLRIFVRDTGQGMPADVLARAGEPFFSTKGVGKGTGLGLASAFEFARSHGGVVDISSALGLGTTISLLLPVAAVKGEIIATPEDAIDPALHGGATILVVEDEAVLRSFVASTLRGLGYSVIEAQSRGMALGLAMSLDRIDLVLGHAVLGLDDLAGEIGAKTGHRLSVLSWATPDEELTSASLCLDLPLSENDLARGVLVELSRLPGYRVSTGFAPPGERVLKRVTLPEAVAAYSQWLNYLNEHCRLPALASLPCWEAGSENRFRIALKAKSPQTVFRYLDVGAALERRLGESMSGKLVAGSADHGFGSIENAYRQCLSGAPFIDYARYSLSGGDRMTFQRLILPFSEDGQGVTHFLGFASFDDSRTKG